MAYWLTFTLFQLVIRDTGYMGRHLNRDNKENEGGLRLDTNRLNTSHSQRLNSGKPLGTGRCGWWCPIDPCPNEPFPENGRVQVGKAASLLSDRLNVIDSCL